MLEDGEICKQARYIVQFSSVQLYMVKQINAPSTGINKNTLLVLSKTSMSWTFTCHDIIQVIIQTH